MFCLVEKELQFIKINIYMCTDDQSGGVDVNGTLETM